MVRFKRIVVMSFPSRTRHVLVTFQMICLTCACAGIAGSIFRVCRTAVATAEQDTAPQLRALADGQHSLKGGERHSYRITLTAGQFLYALVEQQGIDIEIALFNPDGSPVAVTDSPNGRFGSEPILLTATISEIGRASCRERV